MGRGGKGDRNFKCSTTTKTLEKKTHIKPKNKAFGKTTKRN